MLEGILTALAELGLIREDYKHRKRIHKKEKADGRKRPFQKHLLQPSVLVVIIALVITSVGSFLFFTYQRTSLFPKSTKEEMLDIVEWIEKWNDKFGHYPAHMEEIIGSNPMRQGWAKDAWNKPYNYVKINNGMGFMLRSAGSDGKFDTEDDITSRSN